MSVIVYMLVQQDYLREVLMMEQELKTFVDSDKASTRLPENITSKSLCLSTLGSQNFLHQAYFNVLANKTHTSLDPKFHVQILHTTLCNLGTVVLSI